MTAYRFFAILAALVGLTGALRAEAAYPLFFESAEPFRAAIVVAEREHAGRASPGGVRITGVAVPHHLLAADMIAATLRYAAGASYERIILLSPDHYRRSPAPCATTTRPFRTPLGDVPVDEEAALALCAASGQAAPLVAMSNLFSHEHGVQAVLPSSPTGFPARRFCPSPSASAPGQRTGNSSQGGWSPSSRPAP